MTDEQFDTGDKTLDKDLAVYFEYVEGEKLAAIKEVAADKNVSRERFAEIVPKSVLRVAVGLGVPVVFESLIGRIKPESKEVLERAKQIADEHLSELRNHPSALQIMAQELSDEEPIDVENYIRSISYTPQWVGQPPNLRPVVRLEILGRKRRLLLDTVNDWDDLAYLARTSLEILMEHMEASLPIAKANLIDLSETEKIGEKLDQIQENLEKTRDLAAKLGLPLQVGQ